MFLLTFENAPEGLALRCREDDDRVRNIVVALSLFRFWLGGHASETTATATTTQAVGDSAPDVAYQSSMKHQNEDARLVMRQAPSVPVGIVGRFVVHE